MIGEYQGIDITVNGDMAGSEAVEIIERVIYKQYPNRDIKSIEFVVVDNDYVDVRCTFYDEPYERINRNSYKI